MNRCYIFKINSGSELQKSAIFACMKLEISDWNMIPYAGAWSRQTEWFDALVHAKQAGEGYVNHIVLCEHPHVYTLGRSGKERNNAAGRRNSCAG